MNKTQIYGAIHSSFDGSNYKLEIKEASYYTCCILNIFPFKAFTKSRKRIHLHIYFVIYSLFPKEKLLDRRICPGGSYFWTFIAPIKVLLRMNGRTYGKLDLLFFCLLQKDWFSDVSFHMNQIIQNINGVNDIKSLQKVNTHICNEFDFNRN